MATKGSRTYVCRTKPGRARKGCGGGAKVVEIAVKKAVSEVEKRFNKRLAAYKKHVAKRIAKKK